jgi:hypothetical protein
VRRCAAVLVLACVAVGLVACGGGARPTRSEYTRMLGRICRRANTRLAAVELRDLGAPGSARRVGELVRVGRRALDELRAVDPPRGDGARGDGARREAWLSALEQVLDEGAYVESLLRAGATDRAVDAATRADALATRVHRMGRDLGLRNACRIPSLVELG